jgi:carboxymethylenebutenolidase
MCFDCDEPLTRRSLIAGTAAALASAALQGKAFSTRSPERPAIEDPEVLHQEVRFPGDGETYRGFLTRPKSRARRPAVLVMQGNPGFPEWLQNTAARLTQAGFVALVVELAPKKPEDAPKDWYIGNVPDRWATGALLAGIRYVKTLPFVAPGGVGMVGFCFGGRKALMLPTQSPDVKVAVSFYGAVVDRKRNAADPRPDVIEVAARLKTPVQGHYGTLDSVAVVDDARQFEKLLRSEKTPVEFFYYEGAGHGFYGNDWDEQTPEFGFNADAARLAHERMLAFLKKYLG